MKFLIYCRKSSDREDRQILGPEAQKRLLLEHAERHRLNVVDVYVEHQTAYKVGRPLFNAMLERLEKGEAEAILTYHLTRLARNSFDGGRLIYMMDERTVTQIITPEKAYTNNSDDKFMMQIHFAMAKKSPDDTSQFVRRDVESKLLKGEYPGMVPPGYLNINRDGHISKSRDDPEKYLLLLKLDRPLRREEIDPIDAPLVRELFDEAAKGTRSLAALRKLSHALGLRAGKSNRMLSKHAVWNLLTNPYYHGVIEYGGKVYTENIQHAPLITKDLFDRAQEALGRRQKGRYRRHSFAFGGCILRCGECGCPVTAERQKGHVYYHCTQSRGPCSQKAWTREEILEEQLASLLLRLRLPQGYLDYAFGKLRRCHRWEADHTAALEHKLQGQCTACEKKLDALLQLKIAPGNLDGILLSDEEYLRQKVALKADLAELQKQLASARQRRSNWVDDCEKFFHFTQQLAKSFAAAPVEAKKDVLLLVCSNLTLKDHRVACVYRNPYATLADFPLAGREPEFQSEPEKLLAEAEKPEIVEQWLGITTVIRTLGWSLPMVTWSR